MTASSSASRWTTTTPAGDERDFVRPTCLPRQWPGTGQLDAPLLNRSGLALLILLLAVGLRLTVLPSDYGSAFLTLYPATFLACYLCGAAVGGVTIALGAIAGYLIQSKSYGHLNFDGNAFLATLLFVLLSGFMVLLLHRLQVIASDLHARLMAHEGSESNYLQVLESQSDFIARFNAANTITYVNEAFCQMFGMTKEELIGHSWTPLPVEEDIDRVNAALAKLSPCNPVVVIENRVNTPRGVRWAQFINSASFDENGLLTSVQSVGRDFTERKELEERLVESVASFKDFYDNAPCGYYSLDQSGTIIAANKMTLGWLGATEGQVVGRRKMADFFTQEGRASFEKNFPLFVKNGHVEGLEFDVVSDDGAIHRLRVSATAIYGPDGAFLMSRSVMNDVTELRRNKERLRQLTVEQNAMLNNELTGIVKLKDRRFVWVNEAMHRIFGYAVGELEGQSIRMLYPDDASFHAVGLAAYPVVFENGLYRTQLQMLHKDGHVVWVDLQGSLLSGDRSESLWMISDITEIKKSQVQTEKLACQPSQSSMATECR